jgi:hypothetical protein
MVSVACVLAPIALVAVQTHVDGFPTQLADAVPLCGPCRLITSFETKPLPVEVHTRRSDVALLEVQFKV